jgi:thiol-disulfide isomerase/thioredoxin
MKINSCYFIAILFLLMSISQMAYGQVKRYSTFDKFEKEVFQKLDADSVYVINFWATWCGPCVKELPYFEALNQKYKAGQFKQILVSLDDPKKLESKVIPFISKNNIRSEVILLEDGKYNSWIDKVDPRWSGAIPITLIIKGKEKLFYEQEFHSMAEIEIELLKLL